jgi:hypothetical protein
MIKHNPKRSIREIETLFLRPSEKTGTSNPLGLVSEVVPDPP